jgi:hypothetical protein
MSTNILSYLLLNLEDGELELRLDLRVLDLDTLQAVDTPADSRGERLDVARGAADQRAKLGLGESEERGVLLRGRKCGRECICDGMWRVCTYIGVGCTTSKGMWSATGHRVSQVDSAVWPAPRIC